MTNSGPEGTSDAGGKPHPRGGLGDFQAPGTMPPADWPAQATDAVVRAVDLVRERTTGPIQTASRAVVYGLLSVALGCVVGALAVIGLIRAIDALVSVVLDPPRIWITYLLVGVAFTSAGWLVFRRRVGEP